MIFFRISSDSHLKLCHTTFSTFNYEIKISQFFQSIYRFPCEVRVRSTPLLPCRRHGKKRNGKDIPDDEPDTPTEETAPPTPAATPAPPTPTTVKKEGGKKGGKSQSKQVSLRKTKRAREKTTTNIQ